MRFKLAPRIALLCVFGGLVNTAPVARAEAPGIGGARRFALVGASVGEGWNLPAFPARANLSGVSFEYVGVFAFDKSDALRSLLADPTRKPDAVLLKECAAYFPGDLPRYQTLIRGWIDAARNAGVLPVLVTVAPVTASGDRWIRLKTSIKALALGRLDRNGQIQAYNDWLKIEATEQRLPLLDLEAALRVSDADRSLDPTLTSGDGLHLNAQGYARLDRALARLLAPAR